MQLLDLTAYYILSDVVCIISSTECIMEKSLQKSSRHLCAVCGATALSKELVYALIVLTGHIR